MGRYRPAKNSRKVATDRKEKDLDEIYNDIHDERRTRTTKFAIDHTLPGLGQFYCVACARHFQDGAAKTTHINSKIHKKRVKTLEKEVPYTGNEHIKIDNGGPITRSETSV